MKLSIIFILSILICVAQARATVIKFAQDAEVEDLIHNVKKNVKASEPLEFSKETAYLIRMDKKAPMMVVPIEAARDQIEISGYPLNDITEMNTSKEVDRVLSDMLVEINQIQTLSRRHQFALAFQKLDDLQKKYPQVTSLNFLRASILYVSGKRADAEVILQEALKKNPQSVEGQKLLQEIQRK